MKTHTTDAERSAAVIAEILRDPSLERVPIVATASGSLVTLTGVVPKLGDKLAAETAALRVEGVLDIANMIEIHDDEKSVRTDAAVAQSARGILAWDAFVPDGEIRMTVSGGIVTLRGRVETLAQQRRAIELVASVTGVRGVASMLHTTSELSPSRLHDAVRSALARHGLHEAAKIEIGVEGGCVTVSGPVESLQERRAIVGAIRGIRGVDEVHDELYAIH